MNPAPEMTERFDALDLRRCLGSFVTGVTVITALDAHGAPVGMTANSFTTVSLDPPLIAWSLRSDSRSFAAYEQAERFAVNILAEDQRDLANHFARWSEDRFAGIRWHAGLDGVPLLDGCIAHLECTTETRHPGGDHRLFLGRVARIARREAAPLAFGDGRYLRLEPLACAA